MPMIFPPSFRKPHLVCYHPPAISSTLTAGGYTPHNHPPPPWPMVHFGISAISGFHLAIACVENTIAHSLKLRVVHHHQADTPSTLTSGAAPYRIFFFLSMLRFSETSNVHSRRKKSKSKLLKVAYWTVPPGGYSQHPNIGSCTLQVFLFFFSMLRFHETSNVHSRRKNSFPKLLKVAYWTASPGGYFQHPTKKTLDWSP